MATADNLRQAFAGESQANRKYLAFARKAEQEGKTQIAKLFRAAAQAETIHAHNHLRVMGGVKDTQANLEAAIRAESQEFKEMYPKFVAEAEKEENQAALTSFKGAMSVEEIHHNLYIRALEAAKAENDLPPIKIFVCEICGNTVEGELPDKCPICKAAKDKFTEIR